MDGGYFTAAVGGERRGLPGWLPLPLTILGALWPRTPDADPLLPPVPLASIGRTPPARWQSGLPLCVVPLTGANRADGGSWCVAYAPAIVRRVLQLVPSVDAQIAALGALGALGHRRVHAVAHVGGWEAVAALPGLAGRMVWTDREQGLGWLNPIGAPVDSV